MNITINPNHNTQISQSFTADQLAQLIALHYSDIEPQHFELLTTVFQNSVEALFSKGQIPPLVLPPIATDDATEEAFARELGEQNQLQICKQLAFNVVVFKPEAQTSTRQLLLTSHRSIYEVLDIHRDNIEQSINTPLRYGYISDWIESILAVIFANQLPATLSAALAAAKGFELSIDHMGTMALANQDPLGE